MELLVQGNSMPTAKKLVNLYYTRRLLATHACFVCLNGFKVRQHFKAI